MPSPPDMEAVRQSDKTSRVWEFTFQDSQDLRDVHGEVFGDRRNKTGVKADVDTLKTSSVTQDERMKAMDQRISALEAKLESNWFKKIWFWAVSSGTIGAILGGLAVWQLTQWLAR